MQRADAHPVQKDGKRKKGVTARAGRGCAEKNNREERKDMFEYAIVKQVKRKPNGTTDQIRG